MSNVGRTALALVAAAVVLVVMAWFDATVVYQAIQRGADNYDFSQSAPLAALGTVASAGAVLLLTLLAWRSRSAVVGVLYAVVGAYFAFQEWIWASLAHAPAGPPVLPEPLVTGATNVN